ncbi:MAG: hypothetical protein AABZ15_14465 [Nitrospirota bacterium]
MPHLPHHDKLSGICIAMVVLLTMMTITAEAGTVSASYLYSLSDHAGDILYEGGKIFVDPEMNEAYVISNNTVTVFNRTGLEVYRFGENNNLGIIADLALMQNGNILLLSYSRDYRNYQVLLCNYRGEPTRAIEISGVPAGLGDFRPGHIAYYQGRIYLVDQVRLLAVIADEHGQIERHYDIFRILNVKKKDRVNAQMDGFSLDRDGSMLFTLPVMFTACRLSLDEKMDCFGQPGGAKGRFNVISDIITDNRGNYLVADKLKSVVNIYDKEFTFLEAFGYRGAGPGNLTVPLRLGIDSRDRVYVVQSGRRGISVFSLHYN